MKSAIIFMSHHGTTAKVAHLISELLEQPTVKVINLNDQKEVDLSVFDTVIIGGSIHAGKIQRKLQVFCEDNLDELLRKHLGLFICHMNDEQAEEELNHAFPTPLLEHADARGLFGGEFQFKKMNFIEKLIVKKVSGVHQDVSNIRYEAITRFAKIMKKTESESIVADPYVLDMAH